MLTSALPAVFAGHRPIRKVTMARAALNTGAILYGVNDLFIGPRSHTSARYQIRCGDRAEDQSSSGIIVSTGLGSTGWLRSILAGAAGIASSLTGQAIAPDWQRPLGWEEDRLCFSVREPWPSRTSSAAIAFGEILPDAPLTLVSQMPENGVIFSDGIEADFLPFQAGTTATITVAEKKGHLVI
jgi:hypothetical protein